MADKGIKLFSHSKEKSVQIEYNHSSMTDVSTATGPNPWKIKIMLEEMGIPYEDEPIQLATSHQRP